MKKMILLTLTVICFSLTTQAQLKVVKTEPVEEIGGVKYVETTKRGDDYRIRYRDTQYSHIDDFKQIELSETSFNQLYELIMSNWENPPEEDIVVEFGDGLLSLDYNRFLGATSVRLVHGSKSERSFGLTKYLTKRQVEKVFGKK